MFKGHWTSLARRAWAPFDVPEFKLWLTPSAGATDAGAGACSAWSDIRARTTRYATSQGTGAKRPTIGANINGRASLAFASANSQELTNTTDNPVTAGAARYVLIVAKLAGSGSGSGGAFFTFRLNNTGGRVWTLQAVNVGDGNIYFFTDAVSNNVQEAGAGPTLTTPFIIEYELTAGQAPVVRVNNIARTLVGTISATAEAGTTGFRVGSANNGTSPFNGNIADIFIASPIPSVANRALLRGYFSTINGGIL